MPLGFALSPQSEACGVETASACNCALHLKLSATRAGLKPMCGEVPFSCRRNDPRACNTGVTTPKPHN